MAAILSRGNELKITRPYDHLVFVMGTQRRFLISGGIFFIMGITILVKQNLYINTVSSLSYVFFSFIPWSDTQACVEITFNQQRQWLVAYPVPYHRNSKYRIQEMTQGEQYSMNRLTNSALSVKILLNSTCVISALTWSRYTFRWISILPRA